MEHFDNKAKTEDVCRDGVGRKLGTNSNISNSRTLLTNYLVALWRIGLHVELLTLDLHVFPRECVFVFEWPSGVRGKQ